MGEDLESSESPRETSGSEQATLLKFLKAVSAETPNDIVRNESGLRGADGFAVMSSGIHPAAGRQGGRLTVYSVQYEQFL